MPQDFLAEMLEARERVEEARAGRPDDAAVLADDFGKRYDGLMAEVGALLGRLEALPPDDPARAGLLTGTRQRLNAAKYVRGLIRDLNAE